MEKRKYGIVIVTYNRLEILRDCLSHVLGQTIAYDNVLVIDNCSTDGTGEYLDKLPGIECIHMPANVGGSGGFTKGIKEIADKNCDWITVIDDDAILDSNYLEELMGWQSKHSDILAMTGVVKTDGKIQYLFARRWIEVRGSVKRFEWSVPGSEYKKEFFTCDLVSFCGLTFNSKLLNKTGFPDHKYFVTRDDTEFSMRIRKNTQIAVVTGAIIDHRTKKAVSGLDWKTYYSVRNQIFMLRSHYGFKCALWKTREFIRIYNSYLRNTKSNTIRKTMIKSAIIDAWRLKKGKNKRYVPGVF